MLQTLFYIPSHIHGLPVFGFGLLLAAWAVFSVGLLAWLAWRQGWNSDTLSYLPLVAIVAGVIAFVLPLLCKEHASAIGKEYGLPIQGYGVMVLLAVLAGLGLASWRARRAGVNVELLLTLAFWMILPGIVGARVFYVTEYWQRDFWPEYARGGLGALLGSVVNVANGGLVVYGAFFGGVLGLLAFSRKYRIPLLPTADLVAPSLVLGLALGRIGCMMNGCCFGGTCELPWAVTFPAESPPYQEEVQQSGEQRIPFYGLSLGDDPAAAPVAARVLRHSVADHAGLHEGDRLTAVDGQPVKTAARAEVALAASFRAQKEAVVELEDGRTLTLAARSLPLHPTQLYAAISGLILCLLLLAADPFLHRDGALFALLITLYPIARYLEEMIRTDEQGQLGTALHVSQFISLVLLAFAIGLWFYVMKQPKKI